MIKIELYEDGLGEYPKSKIIFGNIMMVFLIALGTIACWFLAPLIAWIYLAIAVVMVFIFYKEIQATVFHRDMALAVGIPATLILYGILFLTGATITASLRSIEGLLIFSLILNPAAAAYQLTYSMKRMFLLSACFGVLSGWLGLLFSYLFNIPSGDTIVVTSSVIFMMAAIFSHKRKIKGWQ